LSRKKARARSHTRHKTPAPNTAAAAPEAIDGFEFLATTLEAFADSTDRLRIDLPAEGSSAHQDGDGTDLQPLDDFSSPGLEAALLPVRQLGYAIDHLRGAVATLRAPQVILSTFSLYRSVGEVAASAYYLADPDISSRDRLTRWLNSRLKQHEEVVYFVDADERPAAIAAYDKCVAQARTAGLDPKRGRDNYGLKVFYVGDKYPSTMQQMDALYQQEHGDGFGSSIYRWLSAFTHGQEHVMPMFRDTTNATPTEDPRVTLSDSRLDLRSALMGANIAFESLRIATQRVADYYGWSTEEWRVEVARSLLILSQLNKKVGLGD